MKMASPNNNFPFDLEAAWNAMNDLGEAEGGNASNGDGNQPNGNNIENRGGNANLNINGIAAMLWEGNSLKIEIKTVPHQNLERLFAVTCAILLLAFVDFLIWLTTALMGRAQG